MGSFTRQQFGAVFAGPIHERYLGVLFLLAGFSTLVCQMAWQRALLTTFGSGDAPAVLLAAVGLSGVGIGALAGGWFTGRPLRLFLLVEILLAVFGAISLDLIALAGGAAWQVLLVLAVPHLLIGATLPSLAGWLQQQLHNTGKSLGVLVAGHAFGAALAALAVVLILFPLLGLQKTLWFASACKLLSAALIAYAARKIGRAAQGPAGAAQVAAGAAVRFAVPALLLAAFIALSQAVLWLHLLGFMSANRPRVAGLALAACLAGHALGALRARLICASDAHLGGYLVRALCFAAAMLYLAVPATALVARAVSNDQAVLFAYVVIGSVAYYTGGLLPMLIHAVDPRTASPRSIAWRCFACLAGAAAGVLVTGWFLLDRYTVRETIGALSLLTLALLLVLILVTARTPRYAALACAGVGAMAVAGWLGGDMLYGMHLERLQFSSVDKPFKRVLESRTGMLAVLEDDGDLLYGNGIAEGRILDSANGMDPLFMVSAVHRAPRKVLVIGLSTGSWAQGLARYGHVAQLDIVESDAAYGRLLRHYPAFGPKVRMHTGDARRWLRARPAERFDLIVVNAPVHWRSNATHVLSAQFLALAKRHLQPGGAMVYPVSGSEHAVYTAASVFRHVVKLGSFIAAGDAAFALGEAERDANLQRFPDLGAGPLAALRRQQYARLPLPDIAPSVRATPGLRPITDDNMASEFARP